MHIILWVEKNYLILDPKATAITLSFSVLQHFWLGYRKGSQSMKNLCDLFLKVIHKINERRNQKGWLTQIHL